MLGRGLTPRCRSDDNPRDYSQRTFPMPRAPHRRRHSLRDRARPRTDRPPSSPASRGSRALTPRRAQARRGRRCASARPSRRPASAASAGRPTYWFGVIDGLLKMSNDNAARRADHLHRRAARRLVRRGHAAQARALPLQHPGAAPQRGRRPADRRPSTGCSTTASRFNRFVMNQLNERLGQFIAAREIDRLTDPDVARRAQPGGAVPPGAVSRRRRAAAHHAAGAGLPGRPVAPARQRGAARAAGAGVIRIEYGGVRVLDLERRCATCDRAALTPSSSAAGRLDAQALTLRRPPPRARPARAARRSRCGRSGRRRRSRARTRAGTRPSAGRRGTSPRRPRCSSPSACGSRARAPARCAR